MVKVFAQVDDRYVNPVFEVFDGDDFILSSYHDIEETTSQVQIYFPDAAQTDKAKRCLATALEIVGVDAPVEVSEIPDEDWKLSYRRHFKTERVSPRIYTHPPWEPMPETKDGEIVLTLDPGMAFGTGKHETTKACLQYIDEIASAVQTSSLDARRSFLDMGCGSGILSIAAAKLGFAPVAGFDIDEEAVQASKENAETNGVSVDYRTFALGRGAVTLDASIEAAKGLYPDLALQPCASNRGVGSTPPPQTGEYVTPTRGHPDAPTPRPTTSFSPADVVVANILGPLLIAFADEIAGFAPKTLVVSGILEALYPEVLAAYVARGYREISHKTIGEWTTGLLVRGE
ncbi:MAG: 50S ribosomal protein L11 methyltransferase [Kiritimatiellia bacterium]